MHRTTRLFWKSAFLALILLTVDAFANGLLYGRVAGRNYEAFLVIMVLFSVSIYHEYKTLTDDEVEYSLNNNDDDRKVLSIKRGFATAFMGFVFAMIVSAIRFNVF